MKLSVIVPFRSADPWRVMGFNYNQKLWSKLDVEMVISGDGLTEGDFSVARALNLGAKKATGDAFLFFGADHIPPSPENLERIRRAIKVLPWFDIYTCQRRYTATQTRQIYKGIAPNKARGTIARGTGALIAIQRRVWEDIGGLDARFIGWGPEDKALNLILKTLWPDGNEEGMLPCVPALWHPKASRAKKDELWVIYDEIAAAAKRGPEALREYIAIHEWDGN